MLCGTPREVCWICVFIKLYDSSSYKLYVCGMPKSSYNCLTRLTHSSSEIFTREREKNKVYSNVLSAMWKKMNFRNFIIYLPNILFSVKTYHFCRNNLSWFVSVLQWLFACTEPIAMCICCLECLYRFCRLHRDYRSSQGNRLALGKSGPFPAG